MTIFEFLNSLSILLGVAAIFIPILNFVLKKNVKLSYLLSFISMWLCSMSLLVQIVGQYRMIKIEGALGTVMDSIYGVMLVSSLLLGLVTILNIFSIVYTHVREQKRM